MPEGRRPWFTPPRPRAAICAAVSVLLIGGCGASARPPPANGPLPASYVPLSVGHGRDYRPDVRPEPALLRPATLGATDLTCHPGLGPRFGVHVELFANRHVVLIAPEIGIHRTPGAGPIVPNVDCYYPVVTLDPTGVVEISESAPTPTLGTLFALWGHSLTPTRLAGFHGRPVHAYVNGRPVGGDPAQIKLRRHDEIVLETSGYVVPHPSYRFAAGL